MRTRIYFKASAGEQQPRIDVDLPFEAVLAKFTLATVGEQGWPTFTVAGKRWAYNPADVDCICEVE